MSAILEQALDPERRAACRANDSTQQVLARMEADERERVAAEALLRQLFAGAVQHGDVTARALFARRGEPAPLVWELIEDALTYSDFGKRAMQVLVNAANGRGCQRDAQQLLAEAGAKWADMQADFA